MERRYEWLPAHSCDPIHRIRNPYIIDLIRYTDSSITFNGYFYLEASIFPIERILVKYDLSGSKVENLEISHIEILEKIIVEDTSKGDYDEEYGGSICFFPTEIATLKYRILKKDLTNEEIEMISKELIIKEVDNEKRSEAAKTERQEREHEEFCKNYKL
jgi:hypothetical protein